MKWFWIGGRFSWPFVAGIVFLALIVVMADMVWRLFTLPAATLLMLTSAAFGVFLLGFVGLWFLLRKAPRRSS